ncbi:MAG: transglycosylase SLT domain-containing protein [Schleiferiaceae bacterium]
MFKHWRWWLTLAAVSFMVGSPNPSTELDRTAVWNDTWSAGLVRVVVVPDLGVMQLEGGRVLGYDVQLIEWWGRRTGHPIEWQYAASVKEALEAVRLGTADVAVGPIPEAGMLELAATEPVRSFRWTLVGKKPENGTSDAKRSKKKKSARRKAVKPKTSIQIPGDFPKPLWVLEADSLNVVPAAQTMFRFARLDTAQWIMPDYMARAWGVRGTSMAKGSFHWAVRTSDTLLLAELNDLVRGRASRNQRGALAKKPIPRPSDRDSLISPFDALLVGHSGWDRFTLNALIFAESRFNPGIVSPAGAVGLMQLLPSTATRMNRGPVDLYNPKANIKVGIRYLRYLDLFWKNRGVPDDQRLPFVMASYNTGPAPVEGAMRRAKAKGYDPTRWFGHVDQVAKGPGGHYARKTRDMAQQYQGYVQSWRRARMRTDLALPTDATKTGSK